MDYENYGGLRTNTTTEHFSQLAPVYYQFIGRIPAYAWLHRIELQIVIKHARLFDCILDAGCATGEYMSSLVQDERTVIGIDSSIAMLRLARRRVPRADFVAASITHLPFRDQTFDLVYTIATIEHVPAELHEVLTELARVCRKSLLFEIPNKHHPFGFDLTALRKFLTSEELEKYYNRTAFQRLYSLYECLYAIAKTHITIEDIRYLGVISESKLMGSFRSRLLNGILQPVAFMFKQRVREFIFVCRRPGITSA